MLRDRPMGESLFVAVAEQSTGTRQPSQAATWLQKAMVDESVDCAVEYFYAGRFLTRTS